MLLYKIVNATFKDADILSSIKLVTMIDDDMDKALSYTEKQKIRKSILKNIEITCEKYKIIYIGQKIAGAYVVIPYGSGYMIDEIYLFKEYRNNGIGTEIINNIKKEYEELYVWVYKNNVKAVQLFERLGFIKISNARTIIMKCDNVYCRIKDQLNELKLGYRNYEGNFFASFNESFRENYYLQSPRQLQESKIGTCFDQVELERELISKLGVDLRTYFIHYPSEKYDISHSFLIYKDTKRYYWVENAWLKYKGLHSYRTKEELFNDVLKKFIATIPGGDFRRVKLYAYARPRYGINYVKYLSHCINGRSMKLK